MTTMKRMMLLLPVLASTALGFPVWTNTLSYNSAAYPTAAWTNFYWTWSDRDDQFITGTFANVNGTQASNIEFRVGDSETWWLTVSNGLYGGTASSATWATPSAIGNSNIPPPSVYYAEFLLVGSNGVVSRTLAKGKIKTEWSLFSITNAADWTPRSLVFEWPTNWWTAMASTVASTGSVLGTAVANLQTTQALNTATGSINSAAIASTGTVSSAANLATSNSIAGAVRGYAYPLAWGNLASNLAASGGGTTLGQVTSVVEGLAYPLAWGNIVSNLAASGSATQHIGTIYWISNYVGQVITTSYVGQVTIYGADADFGTSPGMMNWTNAATAVSQFNALSPAFEYNWTGQGTLVHVYKDASDIWHIDAVAGNDFTNSSVAGTYSPTGTATGNPVVTEDVAWEEQYATNGVAFSVTNMLTSVQYSNLLARVAGLGTIAGRSSNDFHLAGAPLPLSAITNAGSIAGRSSNDFALAGSGGGIETSNGFGTNLTVSGWLGAGILTSDVYVARNGGSMSLTGSTVRIGNAASSETTVGGVSIGYATTIWDPNSIAIGYFSQFYGQNNTVIGGGYAGYGGVGNDSVILGCGSGYGMFGNNNTLIGSWITNAAGYFSTVIGSMAVPSKTTNAVTIGRSVDTVYVPGTLVSQGAISGQTFVATGGTLTTNRITGDGVTNTIIHRGGVIQSWTVE